MPVRPYYRSETATRPVGCRSSYTIDRKPLRGGGMPVRPYLSMGNRYAAGRMPVGPYLSMGNRYAAGRSRVLLHYRSETATRPGNAAPPILSIGNRYAVR